MADKAVPSAPTQAEVEKHLKAQPKSVFQKPYTRDPGVSIVTTKGEVERVIEGAKTGDTVPTYLLRNAGQPVPDPLARTADLLKKAHKGMSREDFSALVASTLDQQVYLALYGHMSDYQRAQIWQRIHKQAFDEQQAALAEAHRRHAIDQKKTDQLLKARSLQERITAAEAKRGKVADGQ